MNARALADSTGGVTCLKERLIVRTSPTIGLDSRQEAAAQPG